MASSHCLRQPGVHLSSSSASPLSCKRGQPLICTRAISPTFSSFSFSGHGLRKVSRSVSSAAAATPSSSSPNTFEEGFDRTSDSSVEESVEGVVQTAWKILKTANSFLPHVVMASTLLAFIFPPSFTWFTNRYYAPALGFLMFAVGINLDLSDFIHAFQRPRVLAAGYFGQFVIKPILGVLFATMGVSFLHLPPAVGM
ncbi:hypothetical protein L7F22_001733 [Adiantum nelumboides]|nr:hypothetical protein [Adiantum nelumboides]